MLKKIPDKAAENRMPRRTSRYVGREQGNESEGARRFQHFSKRAAQNGDHYTRPPQARRDALLPEQGRTERGA